VCVCAHGFFNVWVCVCVGILVLRVLCIYCVSALFHLCIFILFMLLFKFVSQVFYCSVSVFLLLCMFCSVYSVFIVPTGTLRLP
jgi:hypothetical protein